MRWSESGQVNHLAFGGVYGGPKGGGGGGQQYVPPVPRTLTDPVNGQTFTEDFNRPGWAEAALNNEIIARKNQEAEDSRLKSEAADREKQLGAETFEKNKMLAYGDARANALRAFQLQGVDPTPYLASDIDPALEKALHSVPDLDPNPSASFASNLGDTIVNSVLGGKRTAALNQLNQTFTPTYSQNAYSDSLLDQYVPTLLNEQFDPISKQLKMESDRNVLSPTGYGAATDLLNQKRSAAQSTIGDLGRGILAKDRTGLEDYIGGARTTVNSLSLANSFDPSSYVSGAQSRIGSDIANFGGALRNAVGDTKFVDINDLINRGGTAQGQYNPNSTNQAGVGGVTSPAATALEEQQKKSRGLGSTGGF